MKQFYFVINSLIIFNLHSSAQISRLDSIKYNRALVDSIFIQETEGGTRRDKVLHAEPLYRSHARPGCPERREGMECGPGYDRQT